MSDKLVDTVREEDYLIKAFAITKDSLYVKLTTTIVKFVKEIYRHIEPSHFGGEIVVFAKADDKVFFVEEEAEKLYDYAIISSDFDRVAFQLFQNEELPLFYNEIEQTKIQSLIDSTAYVAYIFNQEGEFFYVNREKIVVMNKYSCPSIFALQYHYLNEELHRFKQETVRKVSSQLFKACWADVNHIYFVNKPEEPIQISLAQYLNDSLRGVNVVREYNLGASKPVDVRVFWREANRAALIEVKLMGRSLKQNGDVNSYEYTNQRANEGMEQIKEYIDLGDSDSPNVITKGYLIVVDGRRNNVAKKISEISVTDGMYYSKTELDISPGLKFYDSHKNIVKPIRMFAEPICK